MTQKSGYKSGALPIELHRPLPAQRLGHCRKIQNHLNRVLDATLAQGDQDLEFLQTQRGVFPIKIRRAGAYRFSRLNFKVKNPPKFPKCFGAWFAKPVFVAAQLAVADSGFARHFTQGQTLPNPFLPKFPTKHAVKMRASAAAGAVHLHHPLPSEADY